MTVWFVPRDSAARSVGADEVAAALVDHGHTVVRTSSRGLLWLEPLVERVDDAGTRIGWSNVTPDEVTGEGEMSEMVRSNLKLKPLFCLRVRRDHDAGVIDEQIK